MFLNIFTILLFSPVISDGFYIDDRKDYNKKINDQIIGSNEKMFRISAKECINYRKLKKNYPVYLPNRVSEGIAASYGEFPHMAALGYLNNGNLSFECGGTLISDRHILTAAHCVINTNQMRPTIVRMGTLDLGDETNKSETDYEVEDIKVHPSYHPRTKYHDIALLKLTKSITFSERIFPACIYTKHDDPNIALTAGWGRTRNIRLISKSATLLKGKLSVLSKEDCNGKFTDRFRHLRDGITTGQICAIDETGSSSVCQGDSGGPLQVTSKGMPTLLGIVSFGKSACRTGSIEVFTRVSKYLDWIENEVWTNNEIEANRGVFYSML